MGNGHGPGRSRRSRQISRALPRAISRQRPSVVAAGPAPPNTRSRACRTVCGDGSRIPPPITATSPARARSTTAGGASATIGRSSHTNPAGWRRQTRAKQRSDGLLHGHPRRGHDRQGVDQRPLRADPPACSAGQTARSRARAKRRSRLLGSSIHGWRRSLSRSRKPLRRASPAAAGAAAAPAPRPAPTSRQGRSWRCRGSAGSARSRPGPGRDGRPAGGGRPRAGTSRTAER